MSRYDDDHESTNIPPGDYSLEIVSPQKERVTKKEVLDFQSIPNNQSKQLLQSGENTK